MFFNDHKKALMTIMAKRNPKGVRTMSPTPMKAEVTKSEGKVIDGRHLAAQEMIAAHHEKSPEKLSQAMQNFMDIHFAKRNDETEPSQEGENEYSIGKSRD